MIDSKRIVKNTVFLYIRLFLVLCVTLYTSRVILDKLGVDDYGLYNVVYGIVGLLSFLTGTLSIGTSRFITYELGAGDNESLKTTFKTALTTHLILSAIIIILGESLGVWYVNNVMVCSPERLMAAGIVFQISIATTVLSVILVPFSAEIIAHERMDVYAYIGIFEAVSNLFVVYLISNTDFDRLVFYAILILFVKAIVFVIYVIYSICVFPEASFKLGIKRSVFKNLLSFSGLNIIANISSMLMNQGVVMLFNLFFAPVVVAAQSISNQISQALLLFVNNVRQAINPQVIKLYAENKFDESQKLTLSSTEYVFDLLLLIGAPMILVMPRILDVWLVEVPEYAVVFAQFLVFQNVLDNFNAAFYTPMIAACKIKTNSFAAAITCTSQFLILYVLFKVGLGPLWARYIGLLFCVIWSFILKPYILWKEVGYSINDLRNCILKCLRVLFFVIVASVLIYYLIPQTTLLNSLVVVVLSVMSILFIALLFMNKEDRNRLTEYIRSKLKNRN